MERSNDYAPDLLTLYFIITAEEKKTKLNYWSAPLLPCLPAALFRSLLIPSSISSFNRLSLSQKFASKNKTFLKLIPAVNRGIKMQAALRNELHQQHVHRPEGGGRTQSTPAQSNAIRHQSAAINIVFERNFLKRSRLWSANQPEHPQNEIFICPFVFIINPWQNQSLCLIIWVKSFQR